jgi:hypothetical protein
MRADRIALNTPRNAGGKLNVHSASGHESGRGVAIQVKSTICLDKPEVLPAHTNMAPRFEPGSVLQGNVRPATDEGRFRIESIGRDPASKSHGNGAFEANPISQITSDARVEPEIMKCLPGNFKMWILKTKPGLVGGAFQWFKRSGSGGFTCGTARIERRSSVLGFRRKMKDTRSSRMKIAPFAFG